MSTPRVLISGASIAGPALAYWLQRYGWAPTIVERAAELRTGGQNVDVRGAGREIARRMGIEDDIRQLTTGEQGTRFIGLGGTVVAEFPAGSSDSGGATAELEILRGDLAKLLVSQTEGTIEYRYGDRITALTEQAGGDSVTVGFEHAPDEQFDLVVAADGIRSSTRRLAIDKGVSIRSLGMDTTYLTIPRIPGDDDWWRWYNAPGGRTVTLRPDAVGTIRATLSFLTDSADASDERRTADEQRSLLRDRFADAGWQAQRVLDALDDAQDLYFESIGQVKADTWSRGRVALLGDAAYCASPISGMGTSLALVGAYVLAGELAAHVHHADAFRGYERIMRPYVAQAQQLPPGAPRLANPKSALGIRAFDLALSIGSSRLLKTVTSLGSGSGRGSIADRLFAPPADKIELPDYSHLLRDV
jgi:2-polyprenyl-6-methoxyphenol hydroxylase-like FAD-dependent oxidoreductase